MTQPAEEASASMRAAAFAAALNVAGMSFHSLFWRLRVHGPGWPEAPSIAVSALLFVLLLSRRDRPSVTLGSIAFLVNNVVILAVLWVVGRYLAASGLPSDPYLVHRLGALTVALIAPPRLWVGVSSIVAFSGAAVLQFLAFGAKGSVGTAIEEPWATVAYGIFALGLFFYRVRHQRIERGMAQVRAESAALDRLARVSLAMRDLANTPLQTLELIAALLRARHPETSALVDPMERSLDRLRDLDRMLRTYETTSRWETAEESFDASAVLGRREPLRGSIRSRTHRHKRGLGARRRARARRRRVNAGRWR